MTQHGTYGWHAVFRHELFCIRITFVFRQEIDKFMQTKIAAPIRLTWIFIHNCSACIFYIDMPPGLSPVVCRFWSTVRQIGRYKLYIRSIEFSFSITYAFCNMCISAKNTQIIIIIDMLEMLNANNNNRMQFLFCRSQKVTKQKRDYRTHTHTHVIRHDYYYCHAYWSDGHLGNVYAIARYLVRDTRTSVDRNAMNPKTQVFIYILKQRSFSFTEAAMYVPILLCIHTNILDYIPFERMQKFPTFVN